MHVTVADKFVLPGESFATNFTLERRFTRVTEFVHPQLVPAVVLDGTVGAGKLCLLRMSGSEMLFSVQGPGKLEITLGAGVRLQSCMNTHMVLQIVGAPEGFGADVTPIRSDLLVPTHMSVKLVFHRVLFSALRTTIRVGSVLGIMLLFVGNHCASHFKHFATLITRVLAHVAVYRQMGFDLPFGKVFGTNFALGEFSFLEHVLLGVIFHGHYTADLEFAPVLVTSTKIIHIYNNNKKTCKKHSCLKILEQRNVEM